MLLTLLDKNNSFDYVLPEKICGKYIINTINNNGKTIPLIAVEEENGKWFLKSNKNAYLKDSKNNFLLKNELEPFSVYKIYRSDSTSALLFTQQPTEDTYRFIKYIVNKDVIKIGRSKDSHICFSNKLVSSNHCYIKYDKNGEATVVDTNSSNGTYVNGHKVNEKKLEKGDVIYIMGLKIIYNGKILALNNPNSSVSLESNSFSILKKKTPEVIAEDELDDFEEKNENRDIFYRAPRFKNDIETREFKIDSPPSSGNREELPLMYMLGPAITMGMASLFTGVLAVQNVLRNGGNIMNAMPTLVMSFSMLTGTVLWPVLSKKYEKKKRIENEEKRQKKYKQYLEEIRVEIKNECEKQSRILLTNNIPIEECIERIEERKINLWERTINHSDFAKIRLGIGKLPLNAEFKYQEKKFTVEEDNLVDELYKLVDEPKVLSSVPVTVSLIDEKVSGIIGERALVKELVKSIIFQLTALQGYDELKLIFIYDKEEEKDWNFVKWMPHVWNDDSTVRYIGSDPKDIKELSVNLEKIINYRKSLNDNEKEDLTTHYIVFSMSKDLAIKAEFIDSILKEKKEIGFSLVTVYDELKNLPKECSKVIEITNSISKIYDKDDISGKYTEFKMDNISVENYEDLAIKLANIKLDIGNSTYRLPEMITFLEMFKVGKIEHLNVLEKWRENDPTKTIETEVGVDTMGEPFKLDLHEKFHGPHGLVAGMTGSGKSEFIMTFILSLAVNYHPDEVAFILIDYKGGGMANAFTDLPHLAGTITNLDGAAVKRSLISIQSELKRRQAIFSKASKDLGISNIDIYKYQKLYRENKVSEPLQHLFMISDEFAELKTQQPEFMEQLISAARIGRSLGIHLILATQKPAGVVDDQIWSNSKFRVCLKVQEKADSMDMIKRPDAAEIAETGRFYLQVGFNELFEMGQSAWAGAPYYPSDRVESDKDESISVIDNIGRIVKSAKIDRRSSVSSNPPKQIDEVVKYIAQISEEENIKVRQLWLEPISPLIYIDELKKKYNVSNNRYKLNPVIGEYDDPATQSQHVMTLPISQEGNTIVYGSAGNGKTTFVTSLMYSLMESHTPEEVNMYVLDFASETLRAFEKSPHVGDVLLSYESEKINNLFKMLYSEIERRKKLFADFGGDYSSYIKNSGVGIESLVIIIHNFASFIESYEDKEDDIAYLTREGTKYGIYFVVTALTTNSVRYRLVQNFKNIYALQLNDEGEYSTVLGNTGGVVPSKFKGRGIFKAGEAYEFQTAHIFKETDNTFDLVRTYCNKYLKIWNKPSASKIPVLPEKVDLNCFEDEIKYKEIVKEIPVGVEKSSLKTRYYDFDSSFISVVSANNLSDNTFVQGLAEVMSEVTEEVIVIDAKNSFVECDNKKYRYINNSSEFENIAVELFNTLVERHNTIKIARENEYEIPVYKKKKCIINSFNSFMSYLSDDAIEKVKIFMLNGQSTYNINFILSEDVSDIGSIAYEPWFTKHTSLSNGIWIGNGITDQYQLKLSKTTSEMYSEIGNNFGYIINEGKATLIKTLTSVNEVQEE